MQTTQQLRDCGMYLRFIRLATVALEFEALQRSCEMRENNNNNIIYKFRKIIRPKAKEEIKRCSVTNTAESPRIL